MLQDRTGKDLLLLTLVKITVIAVIYYLCFAAYDGRPVDTVSHMLGPSIVTPHLGTGSEQGQ